MFALLVQKSVEEEGEYVWKRIDMGRNLWRNGRIT